MLPSLTMHFLTYVIIGMNTNIKSGVAAAMRPFGESFEVAPWKRYLDDGEIAAMAKCYGTRPDDLAELARQMEDWNGGTGGVDRKGLHAVLTYNPTAKWDWYEIGGRWDRFLPRNSMTARSLLRSAKLKKLVPHDFVTPDGEWHTRSRYVSTGWLSGRFVEKNRERWLEEFKFALGSYPDHRVVSVDRHM
jgi:hypothetical protein